MIRCEFRTHEPAQFATFRYSFSLWARVRFGRISAAPFFLRGLPGHCRPRRAAHRRTRPTRGGIATVGGDERAGMKRAIRSRSGLANRIERRGLTGWLPSPSSPATTRRSPAHAPQCAGASRWKVAMSHPGSPTAYRQSAFSTLHFLQHCAQNPHAQELPANPAEWMPWNYRQPWSGSAYDESCLAGEILCGHAQEQPKCPGNAASRLVNRGGFSATR